MGAALAATGKVNKIPCRVKSQSVAAHLSPELLFAGIFAALGIDHVHVTIRRDGEQAVCGLIEPQAVGAVGAGYARHLRPGCSIENEHSGADGNIELATLGIEGKPCRLRGIELKTAGNGIAGIKGNDLGTSVQRSKYQVLRRIKRHRLRRAL